MAESFEDRTNYVTPLTIKWKNEDQSKIKQNIGETNIFNKDLYDQLNDDNWIKQNGVIDTTNNVFNKDLFDKLNKDYWLKQANVIYESQKWIWVLKQELLLPKSAEELQWDAAKKVAETMKEKMDSSPIMEWMILAFVTWIQKFLTDTLKIDKATVDSLFKWFTKEDRQDKHSVDNLKTYWITSDWEKWTNNWWIDIFKDTDLSTLDSTKMEPFLDKCREKWIDVTRKDFWENVITNKKIKLDDKTEEKDWKKVTIPGEEIQFNKLEDKNIDWPDFKEFYKTINSSEFIKKDEVVTSPVTPPPEEKTKEQAQQAIKSKIESLDKKIADLDKILLVLDNNTELDKLKSINISEIFNNKDELSLLLTPFIQEYQKSRNPSWSNNWPLSTFLNNHLDKFKESLTEKKNALVKEKETKQKEIVAE